MILFTIDQFVFLFLKCPHILSFIGSIAMEIVRQTQKISGIDGGTENRCFLSSIKKEKGDKNLEKYINSLYHRSFSNSLFD